ncbi:MAG: hypothetical protein ACKVX7_01645 [Planctomycetota bacterium]
MRSRVESVYSAMKKAAAARNATAFRRTLSSQACEELDENLARMGEELTPELIAAYGAELPDLADLEFVDARSASAAAAGLYRGPGEDDGSGEERVRFVWIKVVEEKSIWKYDGLGEVDDLAVQPDGSPTTFNTADLPPELQL